MAPEIGVEICAVSNLAVVVVAQLATISIQSAALLVSRARCTCLRRAANAMCVAKARWRPSSDVQTALG